MSPLSLSLSGYVYLTFESEKSVKGLLLNCTHDPMDAAQYYFKISSRRVRDKEVQVIPWALSDSNSIRCPSPRLDPNRTVFVGGLHGLINAGMPLKSRFNQCSVDLALLLCSCLNFFCLFLQIFLLT